MTIFDNLKHVAVLGFLAGFCFVGMYLTESQDSNAADVVASLVQEAESGVLE